MSNALTPKTDEQKAINELSLTLYRLIRIAKRKDLTPEESKRVEGAERLLQKHSSVTDVLR